MRLAPLSVAILSCAGLACGGVGTFTPSNATKTQAALGFAGAAAVAQVVESAMEARARNNAPVTPSSTGFHVSPQCDNEGQYPCVTVTRARLPAGDQQSQPERDMNDDEARDYVLAYLNGVRKLNEVGPLVRDGFVDTFARSGSDELAEDHRPNQHMIEHAAELGVDHAELQGPPEGSPAGLMQEQLGEILLHWMAEGPGGTEREKVLRPGWRRVGVGIVTVLGRTYLTIDFSS
jgi:hypothetical protein